MKIEMSAFQTLPTVIFQRLDVRDGTPTTTHAIVFESATEAKAEAERIGCQSHLRLLTATDAIVRQSTKATTSMQQ